MKIRRYKKAVKKLEFYVNNFGFRTPFQLLIDGTFCHSAIHNRVQIREDIPKYLGNDIKFLTTQCVILETEKLGHHIKGATMIAKSFGIHKCGHNKVPLTGAACFLSMVGSKNPNRYIIATQDKELEEKLQRIPGVPILYFNRTSAILKKPSSATLAAAGAKQQAALGLSSHEETTLKTMKIQNLGKLQSDENTEAIAPPLKQPKRPNPLSCKKKKRKADQLTTEEETESKKRRKRKRIKLPDHVKREIFQSSADTG